MQTEQLKQVLIQMGYEEQVTTPQQMTPQKMNIHHAYLEQFPRCQHPKLIQYADGSVGYKCPYGAFGLKDQQPMTESWDSCYQCLHFQPKNSISQNK